MTEVRPYQPGDCSLLLARGIRAGDRREAERASGLQYAKAVMRCLDCSDEVFALLAYGKVAALAGIGPVPGMPLVGVPWLVAHADFESPACAVPMARACRHIVQGWLPRFALLENVVDPANTRAVRFLGWLGFRIEAGPVFGPGGYPLARFWQPGEKRSHDTGRP